MRIVFVCSGNICRSPLAQAMLARRLAAHGFHDIEVASFGLVAAGGEEPIAATLEAASRTGLDLAAHRARRFDAADLCPGDHVFVMEEAQRKDVLALTDIDPARVQLLGRLAPGFPDEIADPGGGTEADFDACVAHLGTAVGALFTQLLEPGMAGPNR